MKVPLRRQSVKCGVSPGFGIPTQWFGILPDMLPEDILPSAAEKFLHLLLQNQCSLPQDFLQNVPLPALHFFSSQNG
ncbi:MAG: hypothetical protein E7044_02380 [Lentisphaerae bacterium]|nr:hypothetical protein [Lentisphaerota bacterium]